MLICILGQTTTTGSGISVDKIDYLPIMSLFDDLEWWEGFLSWCSNIGRRLQSG